MINVLAIDTSTNYVTCGIAHISLNGDIEVLAKYEADNPRGHMELLVPGIAACLKDRNLSPADIDCVVVGVGPGPFTGLRVGMATAFAFADATAIPVHGVPSLQATVWSHVLSSAQSMQAALGGQDFVVLSDARRREVYHARYRTVATTDAQLVVETTREPAVGAPETVAAEYLSAEGAAEHGVGEGAGPCVLAASGIAEKAEQLFSPPAQLLDAQAHPTVLGLVAAAKQQALSTPGLLVDPEDPPQPQYLRRPDAKEPAAKPVSPVLDRSALLRLGKSLAATVDSAAGAAGSAGAAGAASITAAQSEPSTTGAAAAVDPQPEPSQPGSPSFRLRRCRVEDAAQCHQLEELIFPDESPWSEQAFCYTIGSANVYGLCVEEVASGKIMGYALLAVNGVREEPVTELYTIAVHPELRGKGWGKAMLDGVLEVADQLGAPVFLEVRTDNAAAVSLYKKNHFKVLQLRKNYYQPSGADAFAMRREGQGRQTQPGERPAARDGRHIILGIESSCDETGVGIVALRRGVAVRNTGDPEGGAAAANADGSQGDAAARSAGESPGGAVADSPQLEILADQVASSMSEHARFGGVVPEIASRAHLEALRPTTRAALREAGIERPDAVAATIGPGLAGALLVGAAAAKAYALAWEVPFYAVNHLGGHVAVDTLVPGVDAGALDNAVALLVSGGHTQILHVTGVGKPMRELGSTLDDAAGEAYDKVARLLGLGYPGGPVIDTLAAQGNPQAITFPRGMMRPGDSPYDFSFSGLKTAVARYVEQQEAVQQTTDGVAAAGSIPIEDVCASFQEAVVDVLTHKAVNACRDHDARVLLLGGGVSANRRLRQLAQQRCDAAGITLHVPPLRLCTDNGVMIAALAAQLIAAGAQPSALSVATDPALEVEVPLVEG